MSEPPKFFTPGPAGEAYAFNRDDETREDVREFCEQLWRRFRPYCPDEAHFLNDARANFHARTWEMTLAVGLLDRGFALERPPQEGPDIKIVNGPVACRYPVWLEATVVTLGADGSPDHAGRIEHPVLVVPEDPDEDRLDAAHGDPENELESETVEDDIEQHSKMAMLTLKPDKTALRYTSALAAKTQQHVDFRTRGIVGPDDIYVVAINGGLLHDYSSGDTDPEILKAVYPIGDAYFAYKIGDPDSGRWGYHYRGHVEKANGVAIPTTAFLDAQYASVSGILFSRCTAWNPNEKTFDYVLTIQNARAVNPLPDGFFPFGREARAAEGQIRWTDHARTAPQQNAQ